LERGAGQAGEGSQEKTLRTPRSAGVAGIIAALMLGAVMVLVRIAIPEHPGDAAKWIADSSGRDALKVALVLLPFGAIAFLWFVGVMRDYIGEKEDRFFSTVLLGAGLLFTAVVLVYGAMAGAFLATVDMKPPPSPQEPLLLYGRHLTASLLSDYASRMAGVFTLTTTTVGTRLGILPRWLSLLGYLVGLVLLLLVSSIGGSEIAFPCWVLVVGIFLITVRLPRTRTAEG
jgi:hypothetical protein